MNLARSLLLALPLVAACSSGTKQLAARFRSPAGMAAFHGYAQAKRACPAAARSTCLDATHLYLAVASGAGDEIRILDPEDAAVVPSEMMVFPLSIPVEMPLHLASSADYFDRYAALADRKPDLLVAASQASPLLHVVNTWDGRPRLAGSIDLAAASPGASVVALAVMPVPDPLSAPAIPAPPASCADPVAGSPSRPCRIAPVPEPARTTFVAGSFRILASLSTGGLAVAEVARDPADPDGGFPVDATDPRNPRMVARVRVLPLRTTQAGTGALLPFVARDLAVSPDGWRVFAATGDRLYDVTGAEVHGVARIDAWRDVADIDVNPLTWPIVGLDARAATRLVTAGHFAERILPGSDPLATFTFYDTAQLDVLAVLDEGSPDAPCGLPGIECGIATLTPDDPARPGIADDPVGELGYRAPLRFPSPAAALGILLPWRGPFGSARDQAGDDSGFLGAPVRAPTSRADNPVMLVGATNNQRQTTAVLAVAGRNGAIYLADPARWTTGLVGDYMTFAGRTMVLVPGGFREPSTAQTILFGVWNDVESNPDWPGHKAEALIIDANIGGNLAFTPGYLPSDQWFLEWHGLLPALGNRRATLQTCGPSSPSPCAVGIATLAFQERALSGALITTGTIADPQLGALVGDAVVVGCRDAQHGAETAVFGARIVEIKEPASDPFFPGGALVIDGAGPAGCQASADPGTVVYLDVRARGMLLRGASFGYAGRPPLSPDAASTADHLEIPEAPGADARENAVKQAVARKARRRVYPTDRPCGAPDLLGIASTCDQVALFPPDPAYPSTHATPDLRPRYDAMLFGPATRGAGADGHRFMIRLRAGVQCAPATATAAVDTSTCLADLDAALGLGAPGLRPDGSRNTGSTGLSLEYGITFSTAEGTAIYGRASPAAALPTGLVPVDRSQFASTPSRRTEAFVSLLSNQILYVPTDGGNLQIAQ